MTSLRDEAVLSADDNGVWPMGGRSQAIDKAKIERLAFVRYLIARGLEEARQPYPAAAASILTLHDAAELFLIILAEHVGTAIGPRTEFMGVVDSVDTSVAPDRIEHRSALQRLNESRRGLKHHGILPSTEEIERARVGLSDFFEDNSIRFLGLRLQDLSLVDLIADEKARTLLAAAQTALAEQRFDDVAVALVRANNQLWRAIGTTSASRFRRSAMSAGRGADQNLQVITETAFSSIEHLERIVRTLALGIDAFKTERFRRLMPAVSEAVSGNYQVQWLNGGKPPSEEDCRWCMDYVVDAGLKIQRALSV